MAIEHKKRRTKWFAQRKILDLLLILSYATGVLASQNLSFLILKQLFVLQIAVEIQWNGICKVLHWKPSIACQSWAVGPSYLKGWKGAFLSSPSSLVHLKNNFPPSHPAQKRVYKKAIDRDPCSCPLDCVPPGKQSSSLEPETVLPGTIQLSRPQGCLSRSHPVMLSDKLRKKTRKYIMQNTQCCWYHLSVAIRKAFMITKLQKCKALQASLLFY